MNRFFLDISEEKASMAHNTLSVWNFYKGWDTYQNHLIKAIEPLTAEQLELKISPNLRSIGSLARHIIRTRAGWLNGLMGEGDPDVAAIAQWEYEGDIPPTSEDRKSTRLNSSHDQISYAVFCLKKKKKKKRKQP